MALAWSGAGGRRDGGSDTASDEEGLAATLVAHPGLAAANAAAVARLGEPQARPVAYWRSADRDTLEAAVVLVVFQRAARYFGVYRYRVVV
jgi:hypothetical protein